MHFYEDLLVSHCANVSYISTYLGQNDRPNENALYYLRGKPVCSPDTISKNCPKVFASCMLLTSSLLEFRASEGCLEWSGTFGVSKTEGYGHQAIIPKPNRYLSSKLVVKYINEL